jgi:hypothetical protein
MSVSSTAWAATGKRAAPVLPTTLAGFTSEHSPSFFRFSRGQRRLLVASTMVDMRCASGASFAIEAEFRNLGVATSGRFGGDGVLPRTSTGDGYTISGTISLAAMLSPNRLRLTGLWRLQMTITGPTGPIDSCDSGSVRVIATA